VRAYGSAAAQSFYRREARTDAERVAANRAKCPRAVAVELALRLAIQHEHDLPTAQRMPLPAFETLEEMSYAAADAVRCGQEISEHARDEAIAFLRDHVRDHEGLLRKVASSVAGH